MVQMLLAQPGEPADSIPIDSIPPVKVGAGPSFSRELSSRGGTRNASNSQPLPTMPRTPRTPRTPNSRGLSSRGSSGSGGAGRGSRGQAIILDHASANKLALDMGNDISVDPVGKPVYTPQGVKYRQYTVLDQTQSSVWGSTASKSPRKINPSWHPAAGTEMSFAHGTWADMGAFQSERRPVHSAMTASMAMKFPDDIVNSNPLYLMKRQRGFVVPTQSNWVQIGTMQTSLDRFSPRKGRGKKSGTLLPACGLVGGGGEGEEGDEKAREKFNSKIHHKLGRLFMPHMVSNRVAAFGATAAPPKEQVPMER